MFNKKIRKIYKYMIYEQEYKVPELYSLIYPDARGSVYDWEDFYNYTVRDMEKKGYLTIVLETKSTYIKIYKRKRFFI